MGSCMSSNKQSATTQYFKKDVNLVQKSQVYEPLTTTLFNTMRKYNDLIVVFVDSNKAKDFSGVSLQEMKSLPAKSIKMMYSFKKLVVVGSWDKCEKDITQFMKQATISSVYVVENRVFEKFQKQNSIFNSQQTLSVIPTAKIPLLVFSSEQLMKPPQKSYQIFIHSVEQKDSQLYSKLKISGVIQPLGSENQDDQIKHYIEKLKNNGSSRVVLVHTRTLGQSALMQILSEYLMFLYQIGEISVKSYLARTLPNVAIIPSIPTQNLVQQPISKVSKSSNIVANNVDEYHKMFKSYINESNPQKAQRTYNLLGKLLNNIIGNPDAENYRKVKAMNKQMEELLTRSKSGIKLLKFSGFNQISSFWVNQLDVKYLKVIRADMDLGFRKAFTEIIPNQ